MFQTLKKFTNLTSNHHQENIIHIDVIITQAKSILKQNANELTQDETCPTQQEKTFKDAKIPFFYLNGLLHIIQHIKSFLNKS